MKWQFWIDRGGTFTDIVARRPDGTTSHREDAVGESRSSTATRRWRASASCWASRPASRCRPSRSRCVKMGTTVATNALLERKGERTLLVTTRGFRDAPAHRLPGASAICSTATCCCRTCSTRPWSRSTSAWSPTAQSIRALDEAAVRTRYAGGLRSRHPHRRDRVHARLSLRHGP
ncbi:MAG: hydantoinase/oxoprolinase N-terminal domain-containing protein [Achromobacter pulmonis]